MGIIYNISFDKCLNILLVIINNPMGFNLKKKTLEKEVHFFLHQRVSFAIQNYKCLF